MTQTTNKYETHEVDHTRFGGVIYLSDYNTDYRGKDNTRGSQIAKRIISDRNFDYRCKKNIEEMKRKKSLEDQKNA